MSIQNKQKSFTFTWIIENISYCWQKKGDEFSSPTFLIDSLENSKFKLTLYPRGFSDDDHIGFFLRSIDANNIPINCELSFLSKDGLILACISQEIQSNIGGTDNFKKRKDVFDVHRSIFLPDNRLIARCKIWKRNEEMAEDVQCFARTRICIERQSFLWNISNFSSLHIEELRTHQIKSVTNDGVVITFDIFFKNPLTERNAIDIQIADECSRIKYLVLHVILVNSTGNSIGYIEKEFLFNEQKIKLVSLPFTKTDLISKKDACLPDDTLSLRCQCSFSDGSTFDVIENVIRGFDEFPAIDSCLHCLDEDHAVSKHILVKNMNSLFQESIFSDMKLKAELKTYSVHKNILSSRSSVFRAMFQSNMKEANNDCVEIQDLDKDTVQRMLQYIYTGEIFGMQWEDAYKLYEAADKYDIPALRNECSTYLSSNLCSMTVYEALVLADIYKDHTLKATAQNFILNRNLFNTEEWKSFMEIHLDLSAETMLAHCQGNVLYDSFGAFMTEKYFKFHPELSRKLLSPSALELGSSFLNPAIEGSTTGAGEASGSKESSRLRKRKKRS